MTKRDSEIKETVAVGPIHVAIAKFVPATRALSSRSRTREGKVARTQYGRFLVLLSRGRWTVSGDVDGFYAYETRASDRPSRTVFTATGSKELLDIFPYLPALVEVGVLTRDEVSAFKAWLSEEVEARHRADRLARIRKDARELGASVILDAELG